MYHSRLKLCLFASLFPEYRGKGILQAMEHMGERRRCKHFGHIAIWPDARWGLFCSPVVPHVQIIGRVIGAAWKP